MEETIARL